MTVVGTGHDFRQYLLAMTYASTKRIDSASRVIRTSPHVLYQAFLDPKAIATWRPPQGMTCKIYHFAAGVGGTYRMAFVYKDTDHNTAGKTSLHEDVFTGRFVDLEPSKRIVEAVDFVSEDPAFAGTMVITTTFELVEEGTRVTFAAEDVPPGIKAEDHQQGMESSLENLAKYTEGSLTNTSTHL
jgi:uncharacterized protein YndB with AHSA1/START domain